MKLRSTLGAARLCTALALVTIAAEVRPALAAPGAETASAHDEAKALTQRAGIAFKLAHFQEALDLYSQAYEKVPLPALLFNIGQCHKNLGHNERALFFFQGYLRDRPDAPNRPAVEILAAELSKAIATERDAKAAAEAQEKKDAAASAAVEAAEREAAEARAAAAREASSAANPPPVAAPPPMHRRSGFLVAGASVAGVGLGLVGAGLYFGLHASSDASALSALSTSHGTWSAHEQSVWSDGQSSARVATALYVAGGVLAAGGVTLAVLGLQKHADGSGFTATVTPSPSGSSLVLSGCF